MIILVISRKMHLIILISTVFYIKPNTFICNVSNMQSYMNTVFCSTQRELRDIKDFLYTYKLLFRKYVKSTAILEYIAARREILI